MDQLKASLPFQDSYAYIFVDYTIAIKIIKWMKFFSFRKSSLYLETAIRQQKGYSRGLSHNVTLIQFIKALRVC